jgi:RimJ/RimL family protein N-acetyltransferase
MSLAARSPSMRSVTLKDGTTAVLRPIRPEDESELSALYARLSPETAYQRFFTVMARLPPSWAHTFANVDYEQRMAIVAVSPDNRLIAVARYDLDEASSEAEIAIVVQDQWQGKGLGTILLAELLGYAEAKGIRRFRADILTENRRMLDVLARLTHVLTERAEHGITSLHMVPRSRADPEEL